MENILFIKIIKEIRDMETDFALWADIALSTTARCQTLRYGQGVHCHPECSI
jgi:hypothetical protein